MDTNVTINLPLKIVKDIISQLSYRQKREVRRILSDENKEKPSRGLSFKDYKRMTKEEITKRTHAIRRQLLKENPDAYIDDHS